MPQHTPEGKVVLYRVDTGAAIARWPVDARAMVATGAFATEPPTGAVAVATEPREPGSVALPPADGAAPIIPRDVPEHPVGSPPPVHPLGIPLVVTRAHEAAPSAPLQEPMRTSRTRKRG